jgi:hypothetical protein
LFLLWNNCSKLFLASPEKLLNKKLSSSNPLAMIRDFKILLNVHQIQYGNFRIVAFKVTDLGNILLLWKTLFNPKWWIFRIRCCWQSGKRFLIVDFDALPNICLWSKLNQILHEDSNIISVSDFVDFLKCYVI